MNKIYALLGVLLAGFLAFLKVFSMGKESQKNKVITEQHEIENESREALQDEKQHSKMELQQNRDNVDAGNFSDFNTD